MGLHHVDPDQGPSAPKAGLAVDSCHALGVLDHVQELHQDPHGRVPSVGVDEVLVPEPVAHEPLPVVEPLVQADDAVDAHWLEVRNVLIDVPRGHAARAAEREALVGDDPVPVPILGALMPLVRRHVEGVGIEPAELDGPAEAEQAVADRQTEWVWVLACVMERCKLVSVPLQRGPCLVKVHAQPHHSVHGDEQGGVRPPAGVDVAVKQNPLLHQRRIAQLPIQQVDEALR
mmetsp:Transcript_128961/g.222826  ORF Transcript_128961/g.222826 Transcript_128961/m.222826 type:complete len:231 (-) Transcript_128961:239-931(-)